MNAYFWNKTFDDLEYLLKSADINYDITAISEARIMKNLEITKNINLKNYNVEYISTESATAGTILQIVKHLASKPRIDLNIYKINELKPTFIERINSTKKNALVDCIFRHPSMNQDEFDKFYPNTLLKKLARGNRTIFLLGVFNLKLLDYEEHNSTNEFVDSLSLNMFSPYTSLSATVTSNSKTLIGNTFFNHVSNEDISRSFTVTISD